jgi:mono/diheme cytochrome c family protein/plastocyanin
MKRAGWAAPGLLAIGFATGVVLVVLARGRDLAQAKEIHGMLVEAGGWVPDGIAARTGEPLHLRLTSDDVVHGFAVGQSDMAPVDVMPGEVAEVTVTFDRPGTYTFYCTRWCGANHWRMRGTIEVSGPADEPPDTVPPRYVAFGIDIDAPHPAEATPAAPPAAYRFQDDGGIPARYLTESYYWSRSPGRAWLELRAEPFASGWDDAAVWDAVAWLWARQTTPERLARGRRLFQEQCAACHGLSGAGDGVFAAEIAAGGEWAASEMGVGASRPADFTDGASMLGAAPALLEGKILRGGMGTGMPSWGPILTSDQIEDIVSYLYTFVLEEGSE